MADLQIGDKVVILKDGTTAVVTKAASVPGKTQTMVECQRDDNDSVNEYWVDQLRLAKSMVAEPAPQPQAPEPAKEPSASESRRHAARASATVAKATRVS